MVSGVYEKRGHSGKVRYWWKGRLPGAGDVQYLPLVPPGHRFATTSRSLAQILADGLWKDAERRAGVATVAAPAAYAGGCAELRRRWLAEKCATTYGVNSNAYRARDQATQWCLRECPGADAFRLADLEKLLSDFAAAGYARRTINRRLPLILSMFRWGAAHDLVPAEVYARLILAEPLPHGRGEPSRVVESVPDDVVAKTLPHLTTVLSDMVRVQQLTGMRSGELCAMAWAQIDDSKTVWLYVPTRHKTQRSGKVRVVAIGPKAQAILERYRRRGKLPIFSAIESERQRLAAIKAAHASDHRTPSRAARDARRAASPAMRAREQWDSQSYAKAIRKAAITAGVPHWHPHQLRHAAATAAYLSMGTAQAQAALGHSHLSVTMQYIDRDAQLSQQVKQAVAVAEMLG